MSKRTWSYLPLLKVKGEKSKTYIFIVTCTFLAAGKLSSKLLPCPTDRHVEDGVEEAVEEGADVGDVHHHRSGWPSDKRGDIGVC